MRVDFASSPGLNSDLAWLCRCTWVEAMRGERDKPIGAIWRRVRDIAPEHRQLKHDYARACAGRWRQARRKLKDPSIDRSSMDVWLRTQKRAFAIETGQIEGLYLLPGV